MVKNLLTSAEVTAFADRLIATLEAAEADRRTLEALRTLAVGTGNSGSSGGQKRAAGQKAKVERPTSRSVLGAHAQDQRILDEVRARKEGIAVGVLIDTLHMNRKALTRALKRLRDAGQVRMEGEKRLARYRVV